jgi:hypothetical protein
MLITVGAKIAAAGPSISGPVVRRGTAVEGSFGLEDTWKSLPHLLESASLPGQRSDTGTSLSVPGKTDGPTEQVGAGKG